MKKLEIYVFVVMLTITPYAFGESVKQFMPMTNSLSNHQSFQQQYPKEFQAHKDAEREAFAKRLGLTAEQKQTLDRQRNEDLKEIKPVLEEMAAKRNEFENIVNSNMPQIEKEAKLLKLKGEMRDLKARADEKRSQNMKRFEAVLTDEQKAEFEKIKLEGRQRHAQPRQVETFGQNRPPHPPQRF